MGFLGFGKKQAPARGGHGMAHHGHDHFDCCGQTWHGREAYEKHRKEAHGGK